MDHFLGMCAARYRVFRFAALAVGAVPDRVHSCESSTWCMRRRASCAEVLSAGARDGFLGNASSAQAAADRVSTTLAQERALYEHAAAVTLEQWRELRRCRVKTASVPWTPPDPDARRAGYGASSSRRGRTQRAVRTPWGS